MNRVTGTSRMMMAVVHSLDGVRFVTTGSSREAVVARVAGYVRERCDDVLPADVCRQVRGLLAAGNLNPAITMYFERVGERWDDEWLEMFIVDEDGNRWTPYEGILSYATS